MKHRISVITFDADQTLIDFRTAMRRALEISLVKMRDIAPAAVELTVDDLVRVRNAQASRLGKLATMEEIRLAGFKAALEMVGEDPSLAAELTAEYMENRFSLPKLYEDVLPVLGELRKTYTLGLASNGNSYPERSGLAGIFAFRVLAQECGARKPEAAFYRTVVEQANVQPSAIMHVGDSLTDDVAGAQAAGLRAVWLNREGTAGDAHGAWAQVKSLREIPEVLAA